MRRQVFRVLMQCYGVAVMVTSFAFGQTAKPTVSEAVAKKVIENFWAGQDQLIPTGQVTVLRQGNADPVKGQITVSDVDVYKALESAGHLKITNYRDLSKGFTNWNDFRRLG